MEQDDSVFELQSWQAIEREEPSGLHRMGWIGVVLSTALLLSLSYVIRVNSLKSQVRLAERQISELNRDISALKTEYEARSSIELLHDVNDLEFGYRPIAARQIIEESELRQYGKQDQDRD